MGKNTADANAQRTANLARIRANQRRSRARRKEYIEDLESRVRHDGAVSVQASVQIQAAARIVVEENRRLRRLLRMKGVSDSEVEAAVSEARTPSAGVGELAGSRRPTAAERLGAMLGAKWARRGGQSQIVQMVAPSISAFPREGSASMPPSDPSGLQHATPLSMGVVGETPPQYPGFSPPGRDLGSTLSSDSSSPHHATAAHTPSRSKSRAPVPPLLDPAPTAAAQPRPQPERQPSRDPDVSPSATSSRRMSGFDASYCLAVADAVRILRPETGQELEAEMGCAEGQDCNMPNSRAFDLLDRYSES